MNLHQTERTLKVFNVKTLDLGKPNFNKGDIITDKYRHHFNLLVTLIAPRLDTPNHYRVHAKPVVWDPTVGAWKLNDRVGNREVLHRNYERHKIQNIKI